MLNKLQPNRLLSGEDALMPGVWSVQIIDNAGKQTGVYQYSYGSALAYATLIMMPDVHIITIERDDVEFQRFDRERIVDSNSWHEIEDLSELKSKGLFINLLA